MEHPISTTIIVATLFEIVGLILLAREVYLGHEMEEIASGFPFVKQLQFLYAAQDFRGFYIASRLDQGDSPADAQKWVDTLGAAAVEKAVIEKWMGMADQVTASIKRWEGKTTPAVMRNRRISLSLGTLLLITAAAVHLVG